MKKKLACTTIIVLIIALTLPGTHALTQVWVTISPPSSQPEVGSNFQTELNISSWDGVVGAFDIETNFDSNTIKYISFSIATGSPFSSNLFINANAASSGSIRISGFQTSNNQKEQNPITVGNIIWQGIKTTGSTEIKVVTKSIVDMAWSPVEVQSYGQILSISPQPTATPTSSPTPTQTSIVNPTSNPSLTKTPTPTPPYSTSTPIGTSSPTPSIPEFPATIVTIMLLAALLVIAFLALTRKTRVRT
jgi:hypothetical protein